MASRSLGARSAAAAASARHSDGRGDTDEDFSRTERTPTKHTMLSDELIEDPVTIVYLGEAHIKEPNVWFGSKSGTYHAHVGMRHDDGTAVAFRSTQIGMPKNADIAIDISREDLATFNATGVLPVLRAYGHIMSPRKDFPPLDGDAIEGPTRSGKPVVLTGIITAVGEPSIIKGKTPLSNGTYASYTRTQIAINCFDSNEDPHHTSVTMWGNLNRGDARFGSVMRVCGAMRQSAVYGDGFESLSWAHMQFNLGTPQACRIKELDMAHATSGLTVRFQFTDGTRVAGQPARILASSSSAAPSSSSSAATEPSTPVVRSTSTKSATSSAKPAAASAKPAASPAPKYVARAVTRAVIKRHKLADSDDDDDDDDVDEVQ